MRTRKPTVDRLETHRGQMADLDFKPIVRVGGELVLRLTGLCLFPCFLMGLVAQSLAGSASDEALRPWALTARWENDSFADSDRYYTDGVSLSITRGGASALDRGSTDCRGAMFIAHWDSKSRRRYSHPRIPGAWLRIHQTVRMRECLPWD